LFEDSLSKLSGNDPTRGATASLVAAVDPSLLVESRASPPGWTHPAETAVRGVR